MPIARTTLGSVRTVTVYGYEKTTLRRVDHPRLGAYCTTPQSETIYAVSITSVTAVTYPNGSFVRPAAIRSGSGISYPCSQVRKGSVYVYVPDGVEVSVERGETIDERAK